MEKLSKPRSVHFFKEMCNYFNIKNVDSANDEPTFHGYGIRNVSSLCGSQKKEQLINCYSGELTSVWRRWVWRLGCGGVSSGQGNVPESTLSNCCDLCTIFDNNKY